MSTFYIRYSERRKNTDSLLCVGLDPDINRLPIGYERNDAGLLAHLKDIIDATASLAVAYKPNAAFFESRGRSGWDMLFTVIDYIRSKAPDSLIVLDAKRGDLGNTASHYATAAFDRLGADAITLSPYMGYESIAPFLERHDKASFVLCLTSNRGARDFQLSGDPPLFERVASLCHEWHQDCGNIGLVVGATRDAEHLGRVRELAPGIIFLIPGVGSQGGNLQDALDQAGSDCLINSSRSILFASDHRDSVKEAAANEASRLVDGMRASRGAID